MLCAPASAHSGGHASRHDGRTVVDVARFGADPSGRRDSAAGIRAAIAHAKTIDGPITIRFSPGTYHIWPEQTVRRELYVSNTSGTNQAVKTENIGILIEDMHDVVVDGGGSKRVAGADADGLVTAVGSGKARIRAYATIGRRTIASEPVRIKVTGEAVSG